MITASHNPKEYNGIKFVDNKGIQLGYDDFLYKIEKSLKKGKHHKYVSKNKGRLLRYDVLSDYVKHINRFFKNKFDKKIKVVFDCSNGVASIPLIPIIENLNLECGVINKEPDGNFPNHDPNQTIPRNLYQLQKEVKKNRADIGIIFDGDADRVAFVDEKGQIVRIDMAFVIFAKNLIDRKIVKRPKILYDLRFSRYVYDFLNDYGADIRIMRVGNPFYKKLMYKDKSILISGELSGHIMFSENYNIDDPLFAALRMIEILSHRNKRFSEILEIHNKYYSSGEISIKVINMEKIMKIIKKIYKGKRKYIDGFTLISKRYWFNMRPSNTEPLVRLIVEGYDKIEVEKEVEKIKKIISENDKE
jgi:phosphomannomutase